MIQQTIQGKAVVSAPTKFKRGNWDKLLWAIQGPIIVFPGGWGDDLPEDIKSQIMIDRMITVLKPDDIPLAPEVEAMWYISSASLDHPLDRDWVDIYMDLTKKWWIKSKKGDLPDFLQDTPELNEQQKGDLKRLRQFIFKKSYEEVKRKCQHQQKKSTSKNQKKEIPSLKKIFAQTDLLQMFG